MPFQRTEAWKTSGAGMTAISWAVTAFGKPDLAILIWPHLAKPNLANTIFGQS